MLKKENLRVGNRVIFSDGNTEFEIIAITKTGLGVKNSKEETWIELDQFEAKPITEKLLLELGAVKLDFKTFPCFNFRGMQINCVRGMWIEFVSQVEITGLHHLQNIFYFRMTEEIKLKPL